MKTRHLLLAVLGALALWSSAAFACVHGSRDYPPGTVIGDYVCDGSGNWRPRR